METELLYVGVRGGASAYATTVLVRVGALEPRDAGHAEYNYQEVAGAKLAGEKPNEISYANYLTSPEFS